MTTFKELGSFSIRILLYKSLTTGPDRSTAINHHNDFRTKIALNATFGKT